MDIMLKIVLYGLSVFEIVLCYKFLRLFWVDERELTVYNKIFMGVAALGVGGMLEFHRGIIFFSGIMFVLQVFICCIPILFISEKNKMLGCEIVCIYFSFVALLDYLFGFLVFQLIEDSTKVKSFYALTEWKVGIYIGARVIMLLLYFYLNRHQEYLKETGKEMKGILAVSSVGMLVILQIYQFNFVRIVHEKDTQILQVMASLLTIIILLCLSLSLFTGRIIVTKKMGYIVLKDELREENYRQLGEQVAESREVMHDMKNHLRILGEYCKKSDIEGIEAYLQKIEPPIWDLDKIVWTQSEILNLILNQKKAEAEKKHIQIDIMTGGVENLPLKDNEICSLFGNLLDNAIEACEKVTYIEPWIQVELQQRKQMIFIKIANSTENLPREVDGEFKSTKQDKDTHGLGLKSVRRIVERNDGDIQFEAGKDSLTVYITLFILKEEETLWKKKTE